MDLEPTYGAPVSVQIRFQLNVAVAADPAFPPLSALKPGYTVAPLFWAQEGFAAPDPAGARLLGLALRAPAAVAVAMPAGALAAALVCVAVAMALAVRRAGVENYAVVPSKESVAI
jgi:hypothetical protein